MFSYIQNMDPVICHLGESIALRWYGLAYVAGFVLGYFVLRSLSRRNLWCLPEEKIADFVTYVAIFGVLIGGRLGYIFFYHVRKEGWDSLWDDPTLIFRVWEGGMASHGGLIGVALFTLYYAKKHQLSFLGLLDGLAIVAPIGLFFGRMANFINGELYGRVTQGVVWAMKFPHDLWNVELISNHRTLAQNVMWSLYEKGHSLVPTEPYSVTSNQIYEVIEAQRQGDPVITSVFEQFLPDRHPSQLYEAFAEGALIFIVLYYIRVKYPKAPVGLFATLFAFLYALGRIIVECYREPDAPLFGALTSGQYFSLFIILLGIALLWAMLKKRKTTV